MLSALSLAAPASEKREISTKVHTSAPQFLIGETSTADGTEYHSLLTSNWAGAVINKGGYTRAAGKFKVPAAKMPPGGDSKTKYCASMWVGIQSDCNSLVQAGVDACIENGKDSYRAWYEWFPKGSVAYEGLEVKEGDEIEVWLETTSDTDGTTTVNNLSSKKKMTHTFKGEKALCNRSAEWVVEDFMSGGSVPFSNFGTVEFTDAHAIQNGKKVTTEGGYLMDIKQNDKQLTKSKNSGEYVTVEYIAK
jgi:hypothetical protein